MVYIYVYIYYCAGAQQQMGDRLFFSALPCATIMCAIVTTPRGSLTKEMYMQTVYKSRDIKKEVYQFMDWNIPYGRVSARVLIKLLRLPVRGTAKRDALRYLEEYMHEHAHKYAWHQKENRLN